VRVQ
jgi:hypothetical protein